MTSMDQRPLWLRALMVVLPAAVGGVLLIFQTFLAQLFGVFLIMAALYTLAPLLLEVMTPYYDSWRLGRWKMIGLIDLMPPLVLFVVAASLLWPTFLGQMVQSQDHTIHLARAWHFVSQMLGHVQLSGWSDWWFAGYPAGEDYPPGADWLTATVYLLTLGLLGWEASYAIAFMAMYAFVGIALYYFGKTYFSRLAGFLGGLFFLLDRGQYREGGWNYTVWWGVWPQVLSTGFTFLFLALLNSVITKARPRDFFVAGLALFLALVSHPISVMYLGLALPIYMIAKVLSENEEKAGVIIARALGAIALGGSMAAFWVLPYMAKGSWMARYGELWKSLPDMSKGLWAGTLFDNVMPPVLILGVFGGAAALQRRRFGGIFLVGFSAVALFVASSTAFEGFGLLKLSPVFGQVQFQRLSIVAKPCLWLLAGYALTLLFGAIKREENEKRFEIKRYILALLLLLVVAPFVKPMLNQYGKSYGKELGRPKTKKKVSYYREYQDFLKWSASIREKELKEGFYRIAYVRPYNDHLFGAAMVYNKTPMYKVGYTPAITFKHKPDVADPKLYKLLNVKYVVTVGALSGNYERVKRFGAISVYRFNDYTNKRYTLVGDGQVEVLSFNPGRDDIELKVSGASANSKLILHVSNYPNWKASLNGERLPIQTAELANQKIFISVPAKNGLIRFHYGMPASNIFGGLLSWIAIAIFILIIVNRYRPERLVKLKTFIIPWRDRAEHYGVMISIVILLLPAVALAFKGKSKSAEQGDRLVDHIDNAQIELVRSLKSKKCLKRGNRYQCSGATWNYVGASSQRVGDALRRCIWAHPVDKGVVRVRFPNIQLNHSIDVRHGLTDSAVSSFGGGASVEMSFYIDDKLIKKDINPNKKGWNGFSHLTNDLRSKKVELRFDITTRRAGGRHYCFDATIK